METTNSTQAVIDFLEGKEAMLHAISTAINMNTRHCSDLLGVMLRAGTLNRTGTMRHYVYSLSPDRPDPEKIYQGRLKIVSEKLATALRLTLKDIRILIAETDWTARAFLDVALKKGDIYKHGKQGYFLHFADYEKYIEISSVKRRTKRLATAAEYRKTKCALGVENQRQKSAKYINIVCQECRQNWQGYQIHKVFGSARA